jgi:hypothetical protein
MNQQQQQQQQIDLSIMPINVPSLCIPRVYGNINERRIREIFSELNLGDIHRVDMIQKMSEKGEKINRVFIHFNRWFSNSNADYARKRLLSGNEIKVVYDNPWFWKISAYREPKFTRPVVPNPPKLNNAPTLVFEDMTAALTEIEATLPLAPTLSLAPTLPLSKEVTKINVVDKRSYSKSTHEEPRREPREPRREPREPRREPREPRREPREPRRESRESRRESRESRREPRHEEREEEQFFENELRDEVIPSEVDEGLTIDYGVCPIPPRSKRCQELRDKLRKMTMSESNV